MKNIYCIKVIILTISGKYAKIRSILMIKGGNYSMKKQIALLTSAVLAVSMVTSCGKNNSSSQTGHKWENSETLNEWQIDLLESQGLPTNIEQLSPTQKRSIQHIYEMITYLNDKYGEEFVYAGYVEPGLMDEETLYAYPKQYGAEGGKNTVEVTLDENGDFTDTYSNMDVSSYAEKLIGDYVRSYFKSDEIAYFMTVNNSDIESMEEVINEDFNWNIGVQNVFFFSDKNVKAEEFEAFVPELANWLYEHKIVANNKLNIIRNIDIKKITYANRDSCYHENNFVYFFDMVIDEDYVITTRSSNHKVEYFDTEEYVNKELN